MELIYWIEAQTSPKELLVYAVILIGLDWCLATWLSYQIKMDSPFGRHWLLRGFTKLVAGCVGLVGLLFLIWGIFWFVYSL